MTGGVTQRKMDQKQLNVNENEKLIVIIVTSLDFLIYSTNVCMQVGESALNESEKLV